LDEIIGKRQKKINTKGGGLEKTIDEGKGS
jgi:hypothetical protein